MNILLITPPLTQLNTPYPATTVLKGYLEGKGNIVCQADLGIELINRIYTSEYLSELFARTADIKKSKGARAVFEQQSRYVSTVEPAIRFLQGKEHTLATRIANRTFLPEGHRFRNMIDAEWAFGVSGTEDKARYFATLFVEDIADYIRETDNPYFDLTKYAESISAYARTFDQLDDALQKEPSFTDSVMLDLLDAKIADCNPSLIGFSVPFPGCLYSALRCAKHVKERFGAIKVVLGGGFPNTELRNISDARIFKYIDYLTLDDGEIPLERIACFLEGKIDASRLVRTFLMDGDKLSYSGNDSENVPFSQSGTPSFAGLKMDLYLSLVETANPMHKLWTYGRWNKMVMAHGCYWAKCAFCDTSLDYICRYDAPSATTVVDRMESIMAETGESGFHFVDEAMPPKLIRETSLEIIKRKLSVSYWGNIRFEKAYTPELCYLMAQSGCVAVSGGLEVASDRLLKLMDKGVTIQQVADATRNLTNAGIMVHSYLMYGFPTETLQETINALEVVRQMFANGLIQSAFWHRFAMTQHSNAGHNPERYGVRRVSTALNPFANNEVDFEENIDYDSDALGRGLELATYNYMHGIGFEVPLYKWFDIKVPRPMKFNILQNGR